MKLVKRYRNIRFKHKLLVHLAMGIAVTLFLSLTVIMGFDYYAFREAALQNLLTHADIISQNSKAALSFGDRAAGRETLSALKEVSDIAEAVIYTGRGDEFAFYRKRGIAPQLPPEHVRASKAEHWYQSGNLFLVRPIYFGENRIGTLCLRYELNKIARYFKRQVAMAVLTAFFVLLVVSGISSRFLNVLIKPVSGLTKTAASISKTKDYSVRAVQYSRDDLGMFTETFNGMLSEIQKRDKELEASQNMLESKVMERTSQLEKKSVELAESSRRAGMADVATSILHNVGNSLNSINVSAGVIHKKIRGSRIDSLKKAVSMLHEDGEPLTTQPVSDEKGRLLAEYLGKASDVLVKENETVCKEINKLKSNVDHVKEIVNMQQNLATLKGTVEKVAISSLVVEALRVMEASCTRYGIRVLRDFMATRSVMTDKHKVLQILVNLISNAKHALKESRRSERIIILETRDRESNSVEISVKDNGVGISHENIKKVFQFGYTTKKTGHGFGLHSSSCSAKDLGGDLKVVSKGPGKGAVFTLVLPEYNKKKTKVVV